MDGFTETEMILQELLEYCILLIHEFTYNVIVVISAHKLYNMTIDKDELWDILF